jgi:hypothetical protein
MQKFPKIQRVLKPRRKTSSELDEDEEWDAPPKNPHPCPKSSKKTMPSKNDQRSSLSSTEDVKMIDTGSKPKLESKSKSLPKIREEEDENDDDEEVVEPASKKK